MKKRLLIAVVSVAFVTVLGLSIWLVPQGAVNAASAMPVNIITNSQQGIWVNGQGIVTVTPDIATVNLGISAQASTVSEAMSQASTAMDKIMAALTSSEVDKKDIQTSYFNIQQIQQNVNIIPPTNTPLPIPPSPFNSGTDSSGSGVAIMPPTPIQPLQYEYQVDNTVTATIRDINKTGAIIDAVATAGGDLTRINGVNFSVDNPVQYYSQARQTAMTDAQNKAQQLAQLSGVNLGKPFYISEDSSSPVVYPMAGQGVFSAPNAVTSINSGQNQITVNVQVAYSIQ